MSNSSIIGILGPTASGKTKLAVHLADKINAEIISMDSRQVYKQLNIGTGKDLSEYVIDGNSINYHLIDSVDVMDRYHVNQFKKDFELAYSQITSKNKRVIACGGTGLYFDVLLNDRVYTAVPVDLALRERLEQYTHEELKQLLIKGNKKNIPFDSSTKKRSIRAIEIIEYLKGNTLPEITSVAYKWNLFGLTLEAKERNNRIDQRLERRIAEGLFEEVESLINSGVSTDQLIYFGLEYKFISEYFLGKYNKQECVEKLKIAIHQFAKRQMTFFRKLEKDGHQITWLPANASVEENIRAIELKIDNEVSMW